MSQHLLRNCGDILRSFKFGRARRFTASTPLSEVQWIALDVETTGLSPERGHRIHQIALLDDFGGNLVADILPDAPRAAAVAILRGVDSNGPSFNEFADDVIALLGRGVVVGYNVGFDLSFLDRELDRLGRSLPTVTFVDAMTVAHESGLTGTLSKVASELSVTLERDRLHEAAYDAALAREVLLRCVDKRGLSTLGDLRVHSFSVQRGGAL